MQAIGWDNAWCSDDTLANKRMYPRHQFPAGNSKCWGLWIKTSDESMDLMTTRASAVQEASPMYLRRKLDQTAVDGLSERAAACLGLASELQKHVPVAQKAIDEFWINAWSAGSEHIDLELQAALIDKSDDFDVCKHVPTLKRLVDQHVFLMPMKDPAVTDDALKVDEFQLLLKQLNYDVDVFTTWQKKCSTAVGAMYFKEQAPWLFMNKGPIFLFPTNAKWIR